MATKIAASILQFWVKIFLSALKISLIAEFCKNESSV